MAKEAWTVFWEPQDAGTQPAANWKEKDIVTKAGEKNSGLFATLQTVSIKEGTQLNTTLAANKNLEKAIGAGAGLSLITNNPLHFKCVTIEAEGAEEAAEAVRIFYGGSVGSGRALACATANLTETVAQP